MNYCTVFVALVAFCGPALASVESCIGKCPGLNPNDDVYFLPHKDCAKYCSCNYGTPVEMNCPNGLHFSSKDRVCVFKFESDCTSSDTPVTSEYDPTTSDSLPLPTISSNQVSTVHGDFGCNGPCPVQEYSHASVVLAHRDCTKFCKCQNGYAYRQECPANLHFSKEIGGCTYPQIAKCNGENSYLSTTALPPTTHTEQLCPCQSSTTIPPNSTSGTAWPITSSPSPHPPPTVRPTTWYTSIPTNPSSSPSDDVLGCYGRCPAVDPDFVVHLIHKECTKFCKCDMGKPFVINCPANLHFNPKLEVCDNPGHAQCTGIGGWGIAGDRDDNAKMNVLGFNKLFRW